MIWKYRNRREFNKFFVYTTCIVILGVGRGLSPLFWLLKAAARRFNSSPLSSSGVHKYFIVFRVPRWTPSRLQLLGTRRSLQPYKSMYLCARVLLALLLSLLFTSQLSIMYPCCRRSGKHRPKREYTFATEAFERFIKIIIIFLLYIIIIDYNNSG